MTQQNRRKNVWITPETQKQLIAIGRAHGAAKGREVSPGIRVAAGYHERLVGAVRDCISGECDLNDIAKAEELLQELDNLEKTK